jgi:hypothetical protein
MAETIDLFEIGLKGKSAAPSKANPSIRLAEITVFDDSNYLSLSYPWGLLDLDEWTRAWYDQALEAKFICPPYHPDAETLKCLHGYFDAGLSPAEAAQAYFGRKH